MTTLAIDKAIEKVPFLAESKNLKKTPLSGGITNFNFRIDGERVAPVWASGTSAPESMCTPIAGRVAIDMLAGPSELVVFADDSADHALIAEPQGAPGPSPSADRPSTAR